MPGRSRSHDLVRTYRTSTGVLRRRSIEVEAVRGVSFEVERGRAVRAARPERRRQDDDDQDADHAADPDRGHGAGARPRRRQGRARGAQADRLRLRRRARALRAALRPTTTSATSPSSTASRREEQQPRIDELLELVGLEGPREGARRGLLARHAPAAAHRARAPARPARWSSSTSRRSASTRSARASCARRSPRSPRPGKTVLLTTHYMFEADALCDRIAVIDKGEIVAEGTPRDLKAIVAERTVIEIEAFGVDERDASTRLRRGRRRHRPSRSRSASRRRCSSSSRDRERELTQTLLAMLDGFDGRPRRGARADARGRVRGARRRTREQIACGCFGVGCAAPLQDALALVRSTAARQSSTRSFFATVAFFMFRAGSAARRCSYASLGAAVMGIWSATSTSRGRRAAARALARDARAARRRAGAASRSCCCR